MTDDVLHEFALQMRDAAQTLVDATTPDEVAPPVVDVPVPKPEVTAPPVIVVDEPDDPDREPDREPDTPEAPAPVQPDATNSGFLGNSDELDRHDGRLVIKTPGQVVQGLAVDGYIDVKADDVTIEHSTLLTSSAFGIRVYDGFGGLTVRNVTAHARAEASTNGVLWPGPGALVDSCDISGHADGIKLGHRNTVVRNFVHMTRTPGSDKHLDALQNGVSHLLVACNTLSVPPSVGGNACFINTTFAGLPPAGVEILHNWLEGGNYSLYVGKTKNGDCMTGVRVVGNRWFGEEPRYGRVTTGGCDVWMSDNELLSEVPMRPLDVDALLNGRA